MRQHIEGSGWVGDAQAVVTLVVEREGQGLMFWRGSAIPAPGHSFEFGGEQVTVRVVDGSGREFSGQAVMTNHRIGSGGEHVDLRGTGPLDGVDI